MTAETKELANCSLKTSGKFVYQDEHGVIYDVSWSTATNGDLDITTITKNPVVWGESPAHKYVNNVLFCRGTITTERQILRVVDGGYVIAAEGSQQVIDFFQATFPCGPKPTDPFCYHYNNAIADDVSSIVGCGPHFTDPSNPDDNLIVWADVHADGTTFLSDPSKRAFQWVNVWNNDDDLTGTCGNESILANLVAYDHEGDGIDWGGGLIIWD